MGKLFRLMDMFIILMCQCFHGCVYIYIYINQNLYALNISIILHISYTSIKLFKKAPWVFVNLSIWFALESVVSEYGSLVLTTTLCKFYLFFPPLTGQRKKNHIVMIFLNLSL